MEAGSLAAFIPRVLAFSSAFASAWLGFVPVSNGACFSFRSCLQRLRFSLSVPPPPVRFSSALSVRPPFGFVFVFIALRILGSQFLGEIASFSSQSSFLSPLFFGDLFLFKFRRDLNFVHE